MADEFPEDSFFRNSNVAVLEAAIHQKESDTCNGNKFEIAIADMNISNHETSAVNSIIVTKKQSHNARDTGLSHNLKNSCLKAETGVNRSVNTTNKSTKTVKSTRLSKNRKLLNHQNNKKVKRLEKSTHEEESKTGANVSEKSDASSDKSKNSYRPLNITRSVVLQSKQPTSSSTDLITESIAADFCSLSSHTHDSSKENTSLLSTQQKLKLDTWGLPQSILKQYAKRSITEMFPWQVECLCCPRVLNGGNLVYSAPTSAGKTLVSEIICIKTILERRKKVIFVLPFVSVVREKMFYFQEIFQCSKVRVDGYMGGHSPPGGFKSLDLAICTIEKANSLVNRLMEENELNNLGAIVVDELHLIGDPHRGYLLELLLTKLKYMSSRNDTIAIQFVGMSATLPNLSLLSTWLDADLYKTSFRPVPLDEFIKVGNTFYNSKLQPVRTINQELDIKNDTEDIVYLCAETIVMGHSVLIFCPTKSWCEALAQTIASEFRSIGLARDINAPESLSFKLREQLSPDRIAECLEHLRQCPVGLDNLLGKVISFGVAYHHAGLSMEERDIVEGCFKNGTLRVLVSTTTLSSGVNLPARRVIIRSPVFQGRSIDILSYRQMAGRAGRMGVDTAGESIIICQKTERRIVANLVCSSLKPIESCLGHGDLAASMKRAVLEVIASGVASTPEDLKCYTSCTLLAASQGKQEENSNPVSSCISFLEDNELIRLQTGEDGILHYTPSPLGQACLSASIHPDEGLRLFQELQRARQCFVLENELHLVYQVTPFNVADQWGNLDWLHVLALWEQLTPDMKRVGELVGVEDRFIVRAMRGTVNLKLEKQRLKLAIHRRFYTALALHDLVNEVPLNQVAIKFNCSRGMLQSLQQSAATYAGMVTSFCHRLGWSSVELLINQFQDRLHFGTHRELLDLLRLPSLNGPRARALYNAGFTSVSELTTADRLSVENALLTAIPFLSDKGRDGETTSELDRRRKLKGIWVTGRQGLSEQEAAELLIKEARSLVQSELGLTDLNWEQYQRKKEDSTRGGSETTPGRDLPQETNPSSPQNLVSEEPRMSEGTVKDETRGQMLNVGQNSAGDVSFMNSSIANSGREPLEYSKRVTQNNDSFEDESIDESNFEVLHPSQPCELRTVIEPEEQSFTRPLSLSNNLSTDLFDNNICSISNLSQSFQDGQSLPKCMTESPKVCAVFSPRKTEMKISENSLEKVFALSFSKLAGEAPDKANNGNNPMKHNTLMCPDSDHHKMDSCLGSWSISNSALERLCMQGEGDVSEENSDSGSAKILDVPKGGLSGILSSIPTINIPVAITNEDSSIKESEDLFDSFTTPICERKLRPRNSGSGSINKTKQSPSSSLLFSDNSASPSLFGDSFEINTGLMEMLDANEDGNSSSSMIAENFEAFATHTEGKAQYFVNNQAVRGDPPNVSKPSIRKTRRKMRIKITDPVTDIPGEKNPPKTKKLISFHSPLKNSSGLDRAKNIQVGLSRKGLMKREAPLENHQLKLNSPQKESKSVLTDSFLEAAFQSAFDNDLDNVLHANLLPKQEGSVALKCSLDSVPHENDEVPTISKEKRFRSESSDEDILSSPQDIKIKPVSKSPKLSNLFLALPKKSLDKVEKQENTTMNKNEIGPPLTRRMLAMRKKSNLEVYGNKIEENQKSSIYLTQYKNVQQTNPFLSIPAEEWTAFNIIDVCRSNVLFKTFSKEILNTTHWTLSLACERSQASQSEAVIGSKILRTQKSSKQGLKSVNSSELAFGDKRLVGVSFCFGSTDAYFLNLGCGSDQCVISLNDRLHLLREIFSQLGKKIRPIVCCFDIKEHYKMLFRCTGIRMLSLILWDPKIGDWLLNPEGKEKTFKAMVLKYAEIAVGMTGSLLHGHGTEYGSPALDIDDATPGRQRSSVEAILCYQIMSNQFEKLREADLLSCFIRVEMPVVACVTSMELSGIGFNSETVQTLQLVLREEMSSLERKAYQLAGRVFSLTSPTDTARVLYQELRLGQGQSMKGYQRNTSKDTLKKISAEHPLPDVILLWRKLNTIHSKTVCPLLPLEPCSRLFGYFTLHTATGRISMHEPNIQSIPRDFEMPDSKTLFSMRSAFEACPGSTLVAADYSQLELRLLAHLSGEPKLQEILNSGQDVFCNLAASWNNISCQQVSDDLRQKAKQLCYGIIYGMGRKALANQLEVEESEAATTMETFQKAFPGIQDYLTKTIKQCCENGYVKTILGRRRFLPGITSSNLHVKAHAERQAVNTTIQGSAADLTKTAMIAIEKDIQETFPQTTYDTGNGNFLYNVPCLVLHLHDELMYEVPDMFVDQFCKILKHGMESAIPLSIKLPVKIKMGESWGVLRDILH